MATDPLSSPTDQSAVLLSLSAFGQSRASESFASPDTNGQIAALEKWKFRGSRFESLASPGFWERDELSLPSLMSMCGGVANVCHGNFCSHFHTVSSWCVLYAADTGK